MFDLKQFNRNIAVVDESEQTYSYARLINE